MALRSRNRRITTVILAAVLVLVFALITGCSNNREVASGDQVAQGETSTPGSAGTDPETPPDLDPQVEETYFRTDAGLGGIWVELVWVTPGYVAATGSTELADQYDLTSQLVFEVALTTHGGNLLEYDYLNNVSLHVAGEELKPTEWILLANDAHHPAGVLVFPLLNDSGSSQVVYGTEGPEGRVDLTFRELGADVRSFSWRLPID